MMTTWPAAMLMSTQLHVYPFFSDAAVCKQDIRGVQIPLRGGSTMACVRPLRTEHIARPIKKR